MAVKSRPLAMYVVAGVLISGVFAGPSVALAQENGVDASLLSEVTESPNEGTVEAETEAPKPVADDDTSAANVDAPANGASEESPESAPQAAALACAPATRSSQMSR